MGDDKAVLDVRLARLRELQQRAKKRTSPSVRKPSLSRTPSAPLDRPTREPPVLRPKSSNSRSISMKPSRSVPTKKTLSDESTTTSQLTRLPPRQPPPTRPAPNPMSKRVPTPSSLPRTPSPAVSPTVHQIEPSEDAQATCEKLRQVVLQARDPLVMFQLGTQFERTVSTSLRPAFAALMSRLKAMVEHLQLEKQILNEKLKRADLSMVLEGNQRPRLLALIRTLALQIKQGKGNVDIPIDDSLADDSSVRLNLSVVDEFRKLRDALWERVRLSDLEAREMRRKAAYLATSYVSAQRELVEARRELRISAERARASEARTLSAMHSMEIANQRRRTVVVDHRRLQSCLVDLVLARADATARGVDTVAHWLRLIHLVSLLIGIVFHTVSPQLSNAAGPDACDALAKEISRVVTEFSVLLSLHRLSLSSSKLLRDIDVSQLVIELLDILRSFDTRTATVTELQGILCRVMSQVLSSKVSSYVRIKTEVVAGDPAFASCLRASMLCLVEGSSLNAKPDPDATAVGLRLFTLLLSLLPSKDDLLLPVIDSQGDRPILVAVQPLLSLLGEPKPIDFLSAFCLDLPTPLLVHQRVITESQYQSSLAELAAQRDAARRDQLLAERRAEIAVRESDTTAHQKLAQGEYMEDLQKAKATLEANFRHEKILRVDAERQVAKLQAELLSLAESIESGGISLNRGSATESAHSEALFLIASQIIQSQYSLPLKQTPSLSRNESRSRPALKALRQKLATLTI